MTTTSSSVSLPALADEPRRIRLARPARGVICHPKPLLADAVARLLVQEGTLADVAITHSIDLAVIELRERPDLLIVSDDLDPADIDEVIETLRHRGMATPVLVLQEHTSPGEVVDQIERGAVGAITLESTPDVLRQSVRMAMSGTSVIPPELHRHTVELLEAHASDRRDARRVLSVLTPRERQVLGLLVEGAGRMQIAARLGLSVHTARSHLIRVKAKLGVRSQIEAASEGRRLLAAERNDDR